MARLVLVGLPGTGKSTLARALGDVWGCAVLDTDDLIAAIVGQPTAAYLRERGEEDFRVAEFTALREALGANAVVATGAGIVATSDARALLAKELTVWLDSDDATLLVRVRSGERPLLGDDHARALSMLRAQRTAWYESCARFRVDASGTPDEVVRRVLDQLESVMP